MMQNLILYQQILLLHDEYIQYIALLRSTFCTTRYHNSG